jgi:ABC-2 type transport system permease protein
MPTVQAEVRKLLTIRSTYALATLAIVATAGLALFLGAGHATSEEQLHDPTFLATQTANPLAFVAVLWTVFGVLVVTHEYRYNLLPHTLTAANRRAKVLVAKVAVVSGFAIAMTFLVGAVSLAVSSLAAHVAHGDDLAPQTIPYGDLLWRTLLFGWGYAIAGVVLALLIRNQVATVVAAFLLFGPIEAILGVALGKYAYMLPFTALGNVLGSTWANTELVSVSHGRAAFAFGVDLAVVLAAGWIGFMRRDASA